MISDPNDPEMKAAVLRARSEIDEFIKILQSGSADFYSIKMRVQQGDSEDTELFWLDNLTYADEIFSGTIDNDPDLVTSVKHGQRVSVKKAEICDWLYVKNQKMYGNYTIRVLLPKYSKQDQDKIRRALAE
jgi:uncharacterized protein YegJ (DUF2314 family)